MSMIPFDVLESRATRWRNSFRRLITLAFMGVLAGTALSGWAVAFLPEKWCWIFLAATGLFEVASIVFMDWYPTHRYGIACPHCRSQLPKAWDYVKRTGRCKECRHTITIPPPPALPPSVPWWRNPIMRSLLYLALVPIAIWAVLPALIQRGIIALPPGRSPLTVALGVLGIECLAIAFIPFTLFAERLRSRRLAEDVPITPPYPVLELVRTSCLTSSAYRVYFAPDKLCFARVAGAMYSESGDFSRGDAAPFLAPFLQRSLRQKRRREAAYDAIDPATSDLLLIDKRNFHIFRPKVQSLTYKPRYQSSRGQRMRCPSDAAGVLTLVADGKSTLWIVHADLSPEEVAAILNTWIDDPPSLSAELPGGPCPHATPPISAATS